MQQNYLKLKTVLIGSSGIGKTSLVFRYVHHRFLENTEPTIGAAYVQHFRSEPVESKTGVQHHIKYEIWDSAGSVRYKTLMPIYYRNAHVVIVAFAVNSHSSFKEAKEWIRKIHDFDFEKKPFMVLVATKLDLKEKRKVTYDEAKQHADKLKIPYLETSAKTNINIKALFDYISQNIVDSPIAMQNLLKSYSTIELEKEPDHYDRFKNMCKC